MGAMDASAATPMAASAAPMGAMGASAAAPMGASAPGSEHNGAGGRERSAGDGSRYNRDGVGSFVHIPIRACTSVLLRLLFLLTLLLPK